MISFYLKKIKFIIDFSFFAVIALLCLIDGGENLISAFSVCLIHETGHLIPMVIFGEKISLVKIYGTGIRIVPYKNPLKAVYKDIIILASGSFTNFLTGAFLLLFFENAQIFAFMNIILGIFNLLPYRNFDGGEIILTLINYYGNENFKYNSTAIIRFISIITSIIILFSAYHYGLRNLTLFITILYLTVLSF